MKTEDVFSNGGEVLTGSFANGAFGLADKCFLENMSAKPNAPFAKEHFTSIRKNKRHLVVGRHYNTPGHRGDHDVAIFIFGIRQNSP